MLRAIPHHLKKYIVDQDYDRYTPVDQAVWRYIVRQLRDYLSRHAHESYLSGLEKTGISVDEIPHIENISAKLEKFGWRAIPVSGFIPPAAFMELQSLSFLPIASDMRSLEHLLYTPAPDIVHEAAGHAPMLAHPEYAQYLKSYAQVAKKAILSKQDLLQYEAIRKLSDLKENPDSTAEEVAAAEEELIAVNARVTKISEGGLLSRMNWWTAEYGLIGSLDHPKIFGAGLLSSVGESRHCLSTAVKKIPLSVGCIEVGYDITEPQPQLFVARDFAHLESVLQELAESMAFRKGGKFGLNRAIEAQTVNTVQLNSGLQISGLLTGYKDFQGEPNYLHFSGAVQLSENEVELSGHSSQRHPSGFGSPLGALKNGTQLSTLKATDLKSQGLKKGQKARLEFLTGVIVDGVFQSATFGANDQLLLLTFSGCKVELDKHILFDPSWGEYDMAVGESISSVFGGPADKIAYGEFEDFAAQVIPRRKYSEAEKSRHRFYQAIRDLRTNYKEEPLSSLFGEARKRGEWLPLLELYELGLKHKSPLTTQILSHLDQINKEKPQANPLIEDGVRLASQ